MIVERTPRAGAALSRSKEDECMARYLVNVEYRGTPFHGFQKQPGLPTVQGALESALVAMTGRETKVSGAGRTDTGVHAVAQAVAFDTPREVDAGKMQAGLNALLPEGISVTATRRVLDSFDPRRDAQWREYRYFILNRSAPSALLGEFTHHFPRDLDLELMNAACRECLGTHDFSAFRAKSQEESPVRNVMTCETTEIFPGLVSIAVRADAFLYRMVRIMAGAITDVGTRKSALDDFTGYLHGGAAKPCADPLPAKGLFLWRVSYPPGALEPGSR